MLNKCILQVGFIQVLVTEIIQYFPLLQCVITYKVHILLHSHVNHIIAMLNVE